MRYLTILTLICIAHISNAARCNITTATTASATTCSSLTSGDTMYITSALTLNSDYAIHASNDIYVIVDGGSIIWDGNHDFEIGSGGELQLINGGALVDGAGSCNANKTFTFGATIIASCNGGGGASVISFDSVNNSGGINSSGALPVDMIYFEAKYLNGQQVLFSWATASELNCASWVLEQRVGTEYKSIYTEVGQGNSNSLTEYSIVLSPAVQNEMMTFRLRQIDFDGTEAHFLTSIKGKREKLTLTYLGEGALKIETPPGEYEKVTACSMEGKVLASAEFFEATTLQLGAFKGWLILKTETQIIRIFAY